MPLFTDLLRLLRGATTDEIMSCLEGSLGLVTEAFRALFSIIKSIARGQGPFTIIIKAFTSQGCNRLVFSNFSR